MKSDQFTGISKGRLGEPSWFDSTAWYVFSGDEGVRLTSKPQSFGIRCQSLIYLRDMRISQPVPSTQRCRRSSPEEIAAPGGIINLANARKVCYNENPWHQSHFACSKGAFSVVDLKLFTSPTQLKRVSRPRRLHSRLRVVYRGS